MSMLKKITSDKTLVMGVLNVTPDSFSDGGEFNTVDKAVARALEMVEEGADIVDIGGESTGPGSKDVSLDEELSRVIPVIEKLRTETDVLLSVDTYKSEVASQAIKLGVDMVNDVTAFRGDERMVEVLASHDVPVVIMYSKDDTPRTTLNVVEYDDVVLTVKGFLEERIQVGEKGGIKRERIIVDPGMGAFVSGDFKYSLHILKRLEELNTLELPILVGPSRKSFIGAVLDLPLNDRVEGGLASSAVAAMNGASILRVHDVKETRRVVDMVDAIINS